MKAADRATHCGLAIWWMRRDLRLGDNQALHAALAHASQVLPLYVLDPALLAAAQAGAARIAFLMASLAALDASLRQRGSRLCVLRGRPEELLPRLVSQLGAIGIWAEADISPYARRRDQVIAAAVPLHLLPGRTAVPTDAVTTGDGRPYILFTPFSKAWQRQPLPDSADLLPIPAQIPTPAAPNGEPLPWAERLSADFPAGEEEARRRLRLFTQGSEAPVYSYAVLRDRLDQDGSSQLSPYLRFGLISARETVVAARRALAQSPGTEAHKGAQVWLNELIWREFYATILAQFPQVLRTSFRQGYANIAWANDADDFAAWTAGLTGYPVVDAAMRQLRESGWIHNRARMVVASFLVKDLLIDWRWGERYFMQQLLDGDPAANNGGWQWVAGTGTDAAPYFRIFNPVSQGERYDPDGVFVRRWLPELAQVPIVYLHKPWQMPAALQREVGCVVGQHYPAPIVDHAWARQRVSDAFTRARRGEQAHSRQSGDVEHPRTG